MEPIVGPLVHAAVEHTFANKEGAVAVDGEQDDALANRRLAVGDVYPLRCGHN